MVVVVVVVIVSISIAGPEIARILDMCGANHSSKRKDTDRHHKQIPIIQKSLTEDVKHVVTAL